MRKNSQPQQSCKILGILFLTVGTVVAFIEIFFPLLTYSNTDILSLEFESAAISFAVLILLNGLLPTMLYISTKKCSRTFSIICIVWGTLNMLLNLCIIYIRLGNIPTFPITALFIDTMLAKILFVLLNEVLFSYFVFFVSTLLFMRCIISSLKKHK